MDNNVNKQTRNKRFSYVTCKIRINNLPIRVNSTLSPDEYQDLVEMHNKLGISMSHLITSLIRMALKDNRKKIIKDK